MFLLVRWGVKIAPRIPVIAPLSIVQRVQNIQSVQLLEIFRPLNSHRIQVLEVLYPSNSQLHILSYSKYSVPKTEGCTQV